jgi:hypothetical protein
MGKSGVVMQYKENSRTCNILGHYDPKKNELEFRLLDINDPSKGVSITYPKGESCGGEHPNLQRSATIDLECANVEYLISSANEPQKCAYHISMKSYYGCPSVCSLHDVSSLDLLYCLYVWGNALTMMSALYLLLLGMPHN